MDHTLTIDTFVDQSGNNVDHTDFVWNYHVWCDMWLNRPDLPDGYSGWNCCDACPVIARGSIYQCGPAPLKAIKAGDTFIGHDTGFMYSCVNSEYGMKIYFICTIYTEGYALTPILGSLLKPPLHI